jgi:hypothetical protein
MDRGLCRVDARVVFVPTQVFLVSVFSNSASMLIVILDLSDHSNRYWATVAMIHNIYSPEL